MKKITVALLCVLFLFAAEIFFYYLWFKKSGFYCVLINSDAHSLASLQFYRNVCLKAPFMAIIDSFFAPGYWPRLHYLFTALFLNAFGRSYMSMAMVNTLYLLILMFAVFGISLKITRNLFCAFLASFLVSVYPGITTFMRAYELPIGVIAFTSLALYFLLLSDYFRKSSYSVLFTVSFILSMYSDRALPLLFIIGPLLLNIGKGLWASDKPTGRKRTILNLCFFLIVAGAVAGKFYGPWMQNILRKENLLILFSVADTDGATVVKEFLKFDSPFFLSRLFFYVIVLFTNHLGIFFFAFIFATFLFFRSNCPDKTMLLLWAAVPFIVLTLIPKKDFSYSLPLLSPLAVMTAVGICSLKNNLARIFSKVFIIIFGILHFFAFMFFPEQARASHLFNFNPSKDPTAAAVEYSSAGAESLFYSWFCANIIDIIPVNSESTIAVFKTARNVQGSILGSLVLLCNPIADVVVLTSPYDYQALKFSDCDYLIIVGEEDFDVRGSLDKLRALVRSWATLPQLSHITEDSYASIDLSRCHLLVQKIHPLSHTKLEVYTIE